MKVPLIVALVGLAISFALPIFAQQTNTPDPQLRLALDDLFKRETEAYNDNDAAAIAATFTEDAVLVTTQGPIYGREAIEKHSAGVFQKLHFSNHIGKPDQYSPHIIGRLATRCGGTGNGM
jgi:hypothetical protein